MANREALQEAKALSELLTASSQWASELFAGIAVELNLPLAVTKALCAMDGPAPMSDLAARLHCDKSYVTSVADQLESLGLIDRVPGPDRRTKMLELTSKGILIRQKLEERVAELSPAMNQLTPAERESLKTLLSKIVGHKGN